MSLHDLLDASESVDVQTDGWMSKTKGERSHKTLSAIFIL